MKDWIVSIYLCITLRSDTILIVSSYVQGITWFVETLIVEFPQLNWSWRAMHRINQTSKCGTTVELLIIKNLKISCISWGDRGLKCWIDQIQDIKNRIQSWWQDSKTSSMERNRPPTWYSGHCVHWAGSWPLTCFELKTCKWASTCMLLHSSHWKQINGASNEDLRSQVKKMA